MRDAQRIQEKREFSVEKSHAVWLGVAVVAVMALSFGAGMVVGKRAARSEPASGADPMAEIDTEHAMHEFYAKILQASAAGKEGLAAGNAAAAAASGGAATLGAPARPVAAANSLPSERAAKATPAPMAAVPEGAGATEPSAGAAPTHGSASAAATAAAVARTRALSASPTAAAGGGGQASSEVAAPVESAARRALMSGPASRGDYTVQVSSFATQEEAKAFAAALERRGFRPFIVAADLSRKGRWFRVRMGRFASAAQAEEAKSILARSDIPAWVLQSD